ncbi:cytidylate kinase family protein [Actinomycetospora sp.]|jgi:cytidylate kinase|uniref:cytidylate kinase family protein n=1 Tax=Actinomycetospora sp. TaxID=1872135 RepID=UPI0039C86D21
MRLVTISAQYGAGGSSIAPAVARALGLPFVDRAIPVQVARELGVSTEESLARDDRPRPDGCRGGSPVPPG